MAKRTSPSENYAALKLRKHGYDLNKVMFIKSGNSMHSVRAALLRSKINESESAAVSRLAKAGWNIESVPYKAFALENGTIGFKTEARLKAEKDLKSKLAKAKKEK